MRMKNLKKYQTGGTKSRPKLSIPLPQTPEGRVYRYSPNETAYPRHFVLGNPVDGFNIPSEKRSRMKQAPGSNQTVCPYSGTIADDSDFTHPDDQEAALKIVEHAFTEDVSEALSDMLKGVASKSKGFLTVKSTPRAQRPRPRFGRRDLMRLLVCDCCGRDYGVFAIGLYCPDCGAPNVALHFEREVELVTKQVEMAEVLDKDQQELAYRLLGNAHEDVLTAFEATLKTVYLHKISLLPLEVAQPKPPGNDFQNVEKGKRRFKLFEIDPFDQLTQTELDKLELNIGKRHVIGHNLGVVDAKFADRARDAKLGETVKLVGSDIKTFAQLCQKVVGVLDDWLADLTHAIKESEIGHSDSAQREEENDSFAELDALPEAIAKWLCRESENGLPDLVDTDRFQAAFADSDMRDLSDALAELEADGMITLSHAMNLELPRIRTTEELFLSFDKHIFETDPCTDASKLINLVLKNDETISVAELHEQSGLTLRRFNPAIAMVISEIGEGRVSREYCPHYPARHFLTVAEDRVALKRLLKRLNG